MRKTFWQTVKKYLAAAGSGVATAWTEYKTAPTRVRDYELLESIRHVRAEGRIMAAVWGDIAITFFACVSIFLGFAIPETTGKVSYTPWLFAFGFLVIRSLWRIETAITDQRSNAANRLPPLPPPPLSPPCE